MTAAADYEIVDCGVDYLTVSCFDASRGQRMVDHALRLMQNQRREGFDIKPWAMSGFAGFACGSVQTGQRDVEALVRVSSKVAHDHWTTFYDLADNCSRLDLQVTVRGPSKPQQIISQTYRCLRRHRRKLQRGSDVSMYCSVDQSSTVYVGKRISDRFARVYDKAAESKLDQWDGCVRYEVEYKNRAAKSLSAHIRGSDDQLRDIKLEVAGYFAEKGYSPRWAPNPPASIRWPELTGDHGRTLRWLGSSVAPAVRKLFDAGRGVDVLDSLGLQVINGTVSCKPARTQVVQLEKEVM
jgi:hypothetical protein